MNFLAILSITLLKMWLNYFHICVFVAILKFFEVVQKQSFINKVKILVVQWLKVNLAFDLHF